MSRCQPVVRLPSGGSPEGWVKVNPEQTGFYRVSYSPEDWARLRPAVRTYWMRLQEC